jgi:hypothetical protein
VNCKIASSKPIFSLGTTNYTCTGRLDQGNHISLLRLCITSFVKENVLYIPDCRALLQEPVEAIWTALRFAFYDSASLNDIKNIHDVGELIRFISGHKDLYIVVDQLNAFEVASNDASNARRVVQAMKFGRRYIFSASADEETNREADGKQTDHSVLRIFGGMSKVHQHLHIIPHSTHTL